MIVPQTEVIITKGHLEIGRHTVTPGEYVLGREGDISVQADHVSRRHVKLTITSEYALIEDLGSSNGTLVNGNPVKGSTRLWPNQKIQIGSAVIELRRVKTDSSSDLSLDPRQNVVRSVLPEEFLRDKKYDIGGVIAQGGMGAILDAREATTRRKVAMKVMLDNGTPDDLIRFISEATLTAQLEHPNIVPVHDLSVDENGQVFYTMKFVRGVTLYKVLTDLSAGDKETVAKYSLLHLLTVFQKVCDAMAFAHSKKVIHRDLKPENIMIGDYGEVLLMDWGLSKVLGQKESEASSAVMRSMIHKITDPSNPSVTMVGSVMGTPQYMAPEQARGEVVALDERSDIYGLGAILYHILALRPPLEGSDPWEIVKRVGKGKIDPLTSPKSTEGNALWKIPESLAAVVRKAMALQQAARYQSVPQLQRDIDAYQAGFATSAEKAGNWKQFTLFIKRNKAASIGLIAVMLIGGTFGTKAVVEGRRAKLALSELRGTAPTFGEQAKSLVENNKLNEALEKIKFAIKLDPSNPDYHLIQANTFQAQSRLREAAESYRDVLELRPKDADASVNLTLCEKLLKENGSDDPLSLPVKSKLLDAILTQKRQTYAISLSQELKRDSDTAEITIKARLKSLMAQPDWKPDRLKKQTDGTFSLNLSGMKVYDLSILEGLPISILDLSNLTDLNLSPLKNVPLKQLYLSYVKGTKLEGLRGVKLIRLELAGPDFNDLAPLAGMPLERLGITHTRISDLSPLRGMPLKSLDFSWETPVVDISPLRGMPLRSLSASATPLRSIEPLHGAPLEWLQISSTAVQSLDGIQGAPLRTLNAEGAKLIDISAIKGSSVVDLNLFGNPVFDLSPLASCNKLERLLVPPQNSDIIFLKKLTNLKLIGNQNTWWGKAEWSGVPTTAEFWKKNGDRLAKQVPMEKQLEKFRQKLIAAGNEPEKVPRFSFAANGDLNIDLPESLKCTDLSELRGLPISSLTLRSSTLHDLSPLAGAPIRQFRIFKTCGVRDLSQLRSMPLRSIRLEDTPITDVSILASIPTLEEVQLSYTVKNVEALRGNRKITMISYKFDSNTNLPTQTAAEFWKEYDAKKTAVPK